MKEGYISIQRSIEGWKYYLSESFTRAQAWIDLILIANHKASEFFIRGNLIKVRRGEVARSVEHLAMRWRWSGGKVKRFLALLEAEGQIEIIKSPAINKIYLPKYDKKQSNRPTESRQKADRKLTDRPMYNNVNNVNNVNKQTPLTPQRGEEGFEEFWSSFPKKVAKKKAEQSWKKLSPSKETVALIVRHVLSMASDPQWQKDGGQFIPHPATYLNQERWKDEGVQKKKPVDRFTHLIKSGD